MTENKRFVNENDGDIRDTSTMRLFYCLSLTGKHLCDLLNWQDERIKSLEQANDEEYLTIQTSAQTLLTHLNHEYHNKKQYNEKFNYEEFQRIREFLTALTILNLTELDEIRKEMEE